MKRSLPKIDFKIHGYDTIKNDLQLVPPNLTKHDIHFLIGDDLCSDHLLIEIATDAQPHRNMHTKPTGYKLDQTDREVFE